MLVTSIQFTFLFSTNISLKLSLWRNVLRCWIFFLLFLDGLKLSVLSWLNEVKSNLTSNTSWITLHAIYIPVSCLLFMWSVEFFLGKSCERAWNAYLLISRSKKLHHHRYYRWMFKLLKSIRNITLNHHHFSEYMWKRAG